MPIFSGAPNGYYIRKRPMRLEQMFKIGITGANCKCLYIFYDDDQSLTADHFYAQKIYLVTGGVRDDVKSNDRTNIPRLNSTFP